MWQLAQPFRLHADEGATRAVDDDAGNDRAAESADDSTASGRGDEGETKVSVV